MFSATEQLIQKQIIKGSVCRLWYLALSSQVALITHIAKCNNSGILLGRGIEAKTDARRWDRTESA